MTYAPTRSLIRLRHGGRDLDVSYEVGFRIAGPFFCRRIYRVEDQHTGQPVEVDRKALLARINWKLRQSSEEEVEQ